MSNRDWKTAPSVYIISNTRRGLVYVGSSANFLSRWWGHVENALTKLEEGNDLYSHMRSDGLTSFSFKAVKTFETWPEAIDFELRLIAAFINKGKPVYNIRATHKTKQFPTDTANPYIKSDAY